MIYYQYNHETSIIEAQFEGKIEVNDIAEHIKNICNDKSLPADLKILTDAKTAIVNFDPKSMSYLIETINKCQNKHNTIREAILQDNPGITAYSYLYQKLLTVHDNHTFQIFSARESALKWLME